MATAEKPANKLVKLEDLDLSEIKHHQLKTKKFQNGQETKSCQITWKNGSKIYLRISKLKVPFGLSTGKLTDDEKDQVEQGKKKPKYSLELNIPEGPEKKKLEEFDELNISYIASCSKDWWGKSISKDSVADMGYDSMIKTSKENKGDYPGRLRIKLNLNSVDGRPTFKVYNSNNQQLNFFKTIDGKTEIDWSWAQREMNVEVIAEVDALWEVNKKCYCTLKAAQIKYYEPDSLPECAFGNEVTTENSEDAKAEGAKAEGAKTEVNESKKSSAKEEEVSEDDEDEDDKDLNVEEDD